MKTWTAPLFAFLATATSLCADSCVPEGSCAQLWPSRGPDWIITPNAGPCVECGIDLFITAEYIFWTAREDHLAFASQGSLQTGLDEPIVLKGNVAHPNWHFAHGFKVGLGFITDHDGWDLYANYTWLRPRTSSERLRPKGNLVVQDTMMWTQFSSILGSTSNVNIIKAKGKWELDFNVIDLELGRNFFISRYLKLRPHFGLKGTWQKQRMDTKYKIENPVVDVATGEDRLDYWGVGIRGGLDTSWHFDNCFSLVGELAVAALWERFDIDRKVIFHNIPANVFSVPIYLDNSFHTIKPVVELFLGLRYEDWFCCDTYHLSLEAGWEQQWWSDQNQFFQIGVETRQGDLYMQGLTIKLRFDF